MPIIQKGDKIHFQDQPATGGTWNSFSKTTAKGANQINLTRRGIGFLLRFDGGMDGFVSDIGVQNEIIAIVLCIV